MTNLLLETTRSSRRLAFGLALGLVGCAIMAMGPAQENPKGDPYVLETCPLSGKKLGADGEAVVRNYEGREVRFCCSECPKVFEENPEEHWKKIDERIIETQVKTYPLDECIVSGETLAELDEEPVNVVYRNRLIRFCCNGCVRKFHGAPTKYLNAMDKRIIEQQSIGYPLETCPLSDEELGARGKPLDVVVANTLVRLCCKGCKRALNKKAVMVLARVNAAWEGRSGAAATQPHSHEDEHDHGG